MFPITRFFTFLNKNIENILSEQYEILEDLKYASSVEYVKIKDLNLPNKTLKILSACMEERLSISISNTEFQEIKTIEDLKALVIDKIENKKG